MGGEADLLLFVLAAGDGQPCVMDAFHSCRRGVSVGWGAERVWVAGDLVERWVVRGPWFVDSCEELDVEWPFVEVEGCFGARV